MNFQHMAENEARMKMAQDQSKAIQGSFSPRPEAMQPISESLQQLEHSVKMLCGVVDRLQEKISPVLKPHLETATKSMENGSGVSQTTVLSEQINAQTFILRQLAETVKNTVDRVGL